MDSGGVALFRNQGYGWNREVFAFLRGLSPNYK
jgi:hypothetical protein